MTSIFKRKGRKGWHVKYKSAGRWRVKSCASQWQADQFVRRVKMGQGGPTVTLKEWAEPWLKAVKATLSHGTGVTYDWGLKHILPELGTVSLEDLTRAHVREFLVAKLGAGLGRRSVITLRKALCACLASAVEDGILQQNVARGLGRSLRLTSGTEPVRAFTRDEARIFLNTAAELPDWLPLFRLLALTGLRCGEALGLKWEDIDWRAGRLHIRRGWARSRMASTKTGRGRTVDLARTLLEDLRALDAASKATALRRGEPRGPHLFPHRDGQPLRHQKVQAAFKRVLEKAGLPGHFTPHGLRHTYARLHLEGGASLKYIQQQLGHRSIGMTADLYGQWADLGSSETADKLAEMLSPEVAPRSGNQAGATVPKSS